MINGMVEQHILALRHDEQNFFLRRMNQCNLTKLLKVVTHDEY